MIALPLLLSLLAAAPAPGRRSTYAVVVGYNGAVPSAGLPQLRFADDDALRLARWLSSVVPPEHLKVLARPDAQTQGALGAAGLPLPALQPPTRTALFGALDSLRDQLKAEGGAGSTVYVFYAGHGLTDRLFLEPELSAEAAVSGRELQARLAELKAEQIYLFVDACRAQSLFSRRGAPGPDLAAELEALERASQSVKLGVLAAAASDRPAGESQGLQGGFFSHALASGLTGAADVDGDARVDFGELAAFVAFNTERLSGQRPWFSPPGGALKATVMELRGTSRLLLPAALSGRVRILARGGLPVVAEAHLRGGHALAFTLPPGRYDVSLLEGAHLRTGRVELPAGPPRDVAVEQWEEGGPAIAARGELDGFEAPFTPEAVAAFDAGFRSGSEPSEPTRLWRHAVDAAYALGGAPFGLPSLEHGVELGYRLALGRAVVGVRGAFRSSAHGAGTRPGAIHRGSGFAVAALRFAPAPWLELSPSLGVGVVSTWLVARGQTSADPAAPAISAGARLEGRVARELGLWVEGRAEGVFVQVDGRRRLAVAPGAQVGVSWRL